MKRALTIAGSDSGGGAGIQADLKTFSAFRIYGASVVTAITAQNTIGVRAVHAVPGEVVRDQLEAVLDDIGVDAMKTGMLFSVEIIEAVAAVLEARRPPRLVVDPVMIAKSGAELLKAEARKSVVKSIFPLCEVLTPNLPEAAIILDSPVRDAGDMRDAARALFDLGPRFVVMKGGHLEGEITDILHDGVDFFELRGPRIMTPHTHGTGCTFSAALAACLARGYTVKEAFESARAYVVRAMKAAPGIGAGQGPLNHGVEPPLPRTEDLHS